jgi:hypothetical protein
MNIKKQLLKLKRIIHSCINNQTDVEQYRHLFTNDFSFWLFKQCVNNAKTNYSAKLCCDLQHNNAFLIVSNYLFGVNDDGKIFCIVGIVANSDTNVDDIYGSFGYNVDILDGKFPTIFGDTIKMQISTKDLLSFNGIPTIRVAGDLLMTINSTQTFKTELCNIFRSYMRQLITNELAKRGIVTEEDWYIPFPSDFINVDQFKHLVDIFQSILNQCGFEITRMEINDFGAKFIFDFGGVEWLLKVEYHQSSQTISYNVDSTLTFAFLHYVKQISNKKLLHDVFRFVGINSNEQTVIINVGNHKIIIHGFNLPVIHIGNHVIRLNSFIADEIICQHPEHLTVNIKFDDYQLVNFNLVNMPNDHNIARNTYIAEKLVQHGKV